MKQFLQGVRLQKLTVSPSVPQWDLSTVLRGLSHEPYAPGDISLKLLSLKKALLLALDSVKHISNLHALLVQLCCFPI